LSQVEFAVWAPTCLSVELLVYDAPRGGSEERVAMSRGEDGVWRAEGATSLIGRYYVYRVTVFSPATNNVETAVSADPASRATSADGQRSQVADINATDLLPPGWDDLAKPDLEHHADSAIYELHVRDFSVLAEDVPPESRGKYVAFESESAGTRHLAALAESGLTHVHLLPVYDFGSVPELVSDRSEADPAALASLPGDSEDQQAAVMATAEVDGFNWGYDPVLFGVPEGSYATDDAVDGAARSLEFRRMVAAINRLGLRVVLDVVYNHLLSSGPHGDKSIYDKVRPRHPCPL
jgi:pullulanase/glycogen debranching enzyme